MIIGLKKLRFYDIIFKNMLSSVKQERKNTMGCSYDVFRATLGQEEYREDFVRLWNEVLEDELYDDFAGASMDCFEGEEFEIDSEPLFRTMLNGEQVADFLKEFLKLHPDAELTAEYECTFNNCSDMVLSYFTYENHVLKIKTLYSEFPYIERCPGCGHEEEEMLTLYDWVENEPLKCPQCGHEFDMDVDVVTEEIEICAE